MVLRTRSAKSAEFLMNESDLPVSVLMILVRNFAMSYIGDPIAETMGRRGTRKITRRMSEALLRQLIKETRLKKVRMNNEIDTYTKQLGVKSSTDQMAQIREWSEAAAKETAENTK